MQRGDLEMSLAMRPDRLRFCVVDRLPFQVDRTLLTGDFEQARVRFDERKQTNGLVFDASAGY